MASCELWKDERGKLIDIWTELGLGPFPASNTKVIQLKYPDHRVIHRMIVNTIHQRKSSHDKVDKIDLCYQRYFVRLEVTVKRVVLCLVNT